MRAYESYIATPLPWLNRMPSHWCLLRNKKFLKEVKETVGVASADYTLLSLTTNGIIPRDVASGKGKFPKDFDTYKIVNSGDIVFCLFDIDETPRTVGLSTQDGMLTGAYNVFHLNGINPRFFTYYYLALDNTKALKPLYSGLRKTIRTNVFLGTKLPVPPLSEQNQIERYLDWQVSKTNRLISVLKKQIILLKEQKRALVNATVTRGGEGWEQKRIINLVQHVKAGAWGEEAGGFGVDFDCVRVADFDFERLRIKDTTLTVRSYQKKVIDNLSLQKGDILIEKSGGGEKQTVGRAVMFVGESPVLYANFIEAIRSNSNVSSAYLTYLLASQYYLERNRFHFNQTTGIQNLHVKAYLRESVMVPPLIEQLDIVKQLDTQCDNIHRLIQIIKTKISLLHEYRIRLISDVVTGQIDVRNVEVPEFEYITDEADDASDDESIDTEETVDEEA